MPFDTLVSAFVTLLLVVDPLGLVPTFLAVTEGLPIVSADSEFDQYPITRIW